MFVYGAAEVFLYNTGFNFVPEFNKIEIIFLQNVFHKTGYPSAVWYILGNEFCERFSYYGMHGKLHWLQSRRWVTPQALKS